MVNKDYLPPLSGNVRTHLDRLLTEGKLNLIFVWATPGAGKTTLTNQIASAFPAIFSPEGIFNPDIEFSKLATLIDEVDPNGVPKLAKLQDKVFYRHLQKGTSSIREVHPAYIMKDMVNVAKELGFSNVGIIELLTNELSTNQRRVLKREEKVPLSKGWAFQSKHILQINRSKPLRSFRPLNWYLVVDNSREDPSKMQVFAEYQQGRMVYQIDNMPQWAKIYLDYARRRLSPIRAAEQIASPERAIDGYSQKLLMSTSIKNMSRNRES